MVVVSDNCLVTVFSADFNIGQPLWDDDFLLIGTLLDIYDLVVFHKGSAYFNGFSDVTELSRTVTSYDNRVGVVVVVSSLYTANRQKC